MLSGLHLVPEHQVATECADISHTSRANQLHVVGELLAIPASRHTTHLRVKMSLAQYGDRVAVGCSINSPVFLRSSLCSSPQSGDGIRYRECSAKNDRARRVLEKVHSIDKLLSIEFYLLQLWHL